MPKKQKYILPIALFVIFALIQLFGWFPALDNIVHDNIMVSSRAPAENIVIVGIDQRTINEIGVWPHPRLYVAEAIERLTEWGAAVIGVNILYSTYGGHPEYDDALVEAAARAQGRLVLGGAGRMSYFQDLDNMLVIDGYEVPFDRLYAHANVGFMNAIQDTDGVMRRHLMSMRFGDVTVHSFAYEVYRAYRLFHGQEPVTEVPLDDYGRFLVRYVGAPGSFTAVSLWGVINEEYAPARFRDAIVLIGPYAVGIADDSFTTPLERGIATHSVELNANVIQNFLEGEFITDAAWWLNLLILTFCALIMVVLFHWLKPLSALFVNIALVAALLFGAWLAYNHFNTIISITYTIIFLFVCYMANLTLGIIYTRFEKQHVKDLFGRFVAPEVVDEIISGGLEVQLGGVVKEVTALFVDVRGFTAFSEANPPEKVVDMINRYLGLTSRAIQSNKGTIDKFIGDATMALFNAPNDVENHALRAVKAAWEMKQGSISLQKEIFEEYGVDLQFGIGINTGKAVVGNMGSDFRMDYTAIGDAINTAARLESGAGKGQIIISDDTYNQVKDHVDVTDMGIINVKNKQTGIQIYSLDYVRSTEATRSI